MPFSSAVEAKSNGLSKKIFFQSISKLRSLNCKRTIIALNFTVKINYEAILSQSSTISTFLG